MSTDKYPSIAPPEWIDYLVDEEWNALCEFLYRADHAGLRALLGGGLGLSAYMPLRRRTKDLDFYIMPEDRDRAVQLLKEAGFHDLYDRQPYDRKWIYRSYREDVIIDIIWQFANYVDEVDEEWFTHSLRVPLNDISLHVVAAEDLLRAKLFVVQRERCDWPDLLNLIHHTREELDLEYIRLRLGENALLFDSLLLLYQWLCPNGEDTLDRPRLLDSRPWFLPRKQ